MRIAALFFVAFISGMLALGGEPAPKIDHVIYITADGFRWQELFGGAQEGYMLKATGGVTDTVRLVNQYGGETAQARREKLLPFFWSTIAKRGQVFGDPEKGSAASVTNGLKFSYPGYSEMLTGAPDPRVDSNKKIPNPNVTVLEWLNNKPEYKGRVYAFGAWNVLASIVNTERSKIHTNGDGAIFPNPANDTQRAINAINENLPRYWADERFDAMLMPAALECLRSEKPRVLYVMLGETDEWAHGRRYDLYLDAANHFDQFVKDVWAIVETDPEYAGRTALVVSTDHGRGKTTTDWTSHGKDIEGAEFIWIGIMGPGVAPLGVREKTPVTQSQIAATLAALLGADFKAENPNAADALPLK
jgi:hypothetical protein